MPKGVRSQLPGERKNVWIPGPQMEVAKQIDNLSEFFQICLDTAPDIMAWAILRKKEPRKYDTGRKLDEVIDQYNAEHPPNELTQKREGTWHKNSPKHQELW